MNTNDYWIVYKWTHISGYYYIGQHGIKNNKEDDGYTGSGILFKQLYDLSSDGWSREVLSRPPTRTLALQAEKRAVGDKWKTDPMCLNLCPGGPIHQRAMLGYYRAKLLHLCINNFTINNFKQ